MTRAEKVEFLEALANDGIAGEVKGGFELSVPTEDLPVDATGFRNCRIEGLKKLSNGFLWLLKEYRGQQRKILRLKKELADANMRLMWHDEVPEETVQ